MNKGIVFALSLLGGAAAPAQEVNFQDSMMYYYQRNSFKKAIYWGEKYAEATKEKKDTTYAGAINNLGMAHAQNGEYVLAVPLIKEAAEIFKQHYGAHNTTFLFILHSLADTYQKLGRLADAETTVLEIINGYRGADTLTQTYADALTLLGIVYKQTARFALSEQTYKRSIAVLNKAGLIKTGKYAEALNSIAVLYYTMARYKEAEDFMQKAVAIKKEVFGENHQEYANTAGNLAAVYSQLGNYGSATVIFEKILPVVKNQLGETHPTYARISGNLAVTYFLLGEYKKAEPLMLKQLQVNEKTYGNKSREYATALHNLGNLYFKMSMNDRAGHYLREAEKLRRTLFPEEESSYAQTLNSLGLLATRLNDFSRADSLYKKAIGITEKDFGKTHPDYLNFQNNHFEYLQKSKQHSLLAAVAFDLLQNETIVLRERLNYLSTTELQAYLIANGIYFLQLPAALRFQKNDSLAKSIYDNRLLVKGIAVQNFTSLSRQMETSSDSSTTKLWRAYKADKAQLNKQLVLPLAKRTLNADSLSNAVNQKEKQLLDVSAPYRDVYQQLAITWQDVKKGLRANEAAVEFIRYRLQNEKNDYVFRYAALLLRRQDAAPLFVDLCNEEELLAAMKKFAYKSNAPIHLPPAKTSKTVYGLVWLPLEKYLASTRVVYFSPDGLLHGIAFAAMPVTPSRLLADRYQAVQLTSTRQLALPDTGTGKPATALLFGGINYNRQNTDSAGNADAYAYVYQQNHRSLADSFAYLPGTLQEVNGIAKKLQAANIRVQYHTGAGASESSFRQACNPISPGIIHFATHGFTLPDTASQKEAAAVYTVSKNPLLRTGLVMAAGNRGWKRQNTVDEDDGILTGLEIASVPLSNTQLAVLSACETANGEVRGSEGVFGLQRAFKLAGVTYIMASLWQVPDAQTEEFMTLFYEIWLKGTSLPNAFYRTQIAMRKKYSPYYWAGFTLVK